MSTELLPTPHTLSSVFTHELDVDMDSTMDTSPLDDSDTHEIDVDMDVTMDRSSSEDTDVSFF